ncbi:DUF4157 domain-containing protein [Kitasatospora herbaricolor]|uniref:DUF4157 domain-containing protein n=2 Tax=Kitasatospora herbaricolor TaxID=68217 RepID=A0ABZ1W0D0_9ACTN|nr:DUF4157 domain-containing protein [Kitasatospora herbaricolor]
MHNNVPDKTPGREAHAGPARRPTASAGPDDSFGPMSLLALQRSVGNAAVVQMLRRAGHIPPAVQRHEHDAGCGHRSGQQAPIGEAPVQRSAVPEVLRSTGHPLDTATRTEMEARLGADFTNVRIHDDTVAQRSAGEIGARAYTSGHHVVIGSGGGDKHTLAHELTHVVQQRQGPVAGADNGSGLKVSDPSDRFEREAEANATRVMRSPTPGDASIDRDRTAPAAESGSLQLAPTVRETRLIGQVGPSCWLYVLEAMANAYGLPTTGLNAAMRAFPTSTERNARAAQTGGERRATGVQMMRENLESMRTMVQSLPGDTVSFQQLQNTIGTVVAVEGQRDAFARSISPLQQDLRKPDVIALFDLAIAKSALLLTLVSADGDEVNTILNSGQQVISPPNGTSQDRALDRQDAKTAMAQVQQLPQYMTVRKRFTSQTVTAQDRQTIRDFRAVPANAGRAALLDWTQRAGLSATAHAVLLTNYDAAAELVYYKDPNVPAAEIMITFDQFLEMAGAPPTPAAPSTDRLTLRPFIPGTNGRMSNLERLAD